MMKKNAHSTVTRMVVIAEAEKRQLNPERKVLVETPKLELKNYVRKKGGAEKELCVQVDKTNYPEGKIALCAQHSARVL